MDIENIKLFLIIGAILLLMGCGIYSLSASINECMDEGHGFYYCHGLMNGRR